jgi:hypothetical protein
MVVTAVTAAMVVVMSQATFMAVIEVAIGMAAQAIGMATAIGTVVIGMDAIGTLAIGMGIAAIGGMVGGGHMV